MPKVVGTVVGTLLLAVGVAVPLVRYLVESSGAMKFATLAIAAALLVLGWALLAWSQGMPRRWGADESKGGPSTRRTTASLDRPLLRHTCRAESLGRVTE